jgi:hypothetical protein
MAGDLLMLLAGCRIDRHRLELHLERGGQGFNPALQIGKQQ